MFGRRRVEDASARFLPHREDRQASRSLPGKMKNSQHRMIHRRRWKPDRKNHYQARTALWPSGDQSRPCSPLSTFWARRTTANTLEQTIPPLRRACQSAKRDFFAFFTKNRGRKQINLPSEFAQNPPTKSYLAKPTRKPAAQRDRDRHREPVLIAVVRSGTPYARLDRRRSAYRSYRRSCRSARRG